MSTEQMPSVLNNQFTFNELDNKSSNKFKRAIGKLETPEQLKSFHFAYMRAIAYMDRDERFKYTAPFGENKVMDDSHKSFYAKVHNHVQRLGK